MVRRCAAAWECVDDRPFGLGNRTFDGNPSDFWLRVTVAAGVIRVQVSHDGLRWPLLRLAPFPDAPAYRIGPMCCTPERAGLAVDFSDFTVGPPLAGNCTTSRDVCDSQWSNGPQSVEVD